MGPPELQETAYQFEYGKTVSYGMKAPASAKAVGSGTSLAANSTRLEAGTRTFQAQFNAGTWSGQWGEV
mgnify:CR=1 FL=1